MLMNLVIVVERSDYPRAVFYEPSTARVGCAKGYIGESLVTRKGSRHD